MTRTVDRFPSPVPLWERQTPTKFPYQVYERTCINCETDFYSVYQTGCFCTLRCRKEWSKLWVEHLGWETFNLPYSFHDCLFNIEAMSLDQTCVVCGERRRQYMKKSRKQRSSVSRGVLACSDGCDSLLRSTIGTRLDAYLAGSRTPISRLIVLPCRFCISPTFTHSPSPLCLRCGSLGRANSPLPRDPAGVLPSGKELKTWKV